MVKKSILPTLILIGAATLFTSFTHAESFVVLTSGSASSITKKLEKAGVTVDQVVEEAGMVVVESSDDSFSNSLPSGVTVVPNIELSGTEPVDVIEYAGSHPSAPTDDDFYFDLQ